MQNEHQTHKDELEQSQRRFKAVKQKAEFAAQVSQQLSEKKVLLEKELGETKVKHDRLNGQHEELSEKYSSVLTKSDEEKSKLIDENTTLRDKINVLEEDQRKLNVNIDSLNGKIQEYKEKVQCLEGPTIVHSQ